MTFHSIRDFCSNEMNTRTACVIFAAVLCVVAPFDIAQLLFAVIGALAYAVLQAFSGPANKCQFEAKQEQRKRTPTVRSAAPRQCGGLRTRQSAPTRPHPPPAVTKQDVYQPSCVPVVAPKFQSTGWEGEVAELVSQLMPGVDEEKVVQQLVLHVKQTIQALFPEVEVTGSAHGSLKCGKAFGVAVPEVDIVANVNPILLAQRLQQQRSRTQQSHADVKKLQKSAIRMCTDRLVQSGGLKFRRSAFRGEEPRVTLLVPTSLSFFTDAIPMDFTVNAVTPFYTAALLTECGQIEPRAKALMLFVKRWAKDRGICHASKGHLSPYLWGLLVMYFMQVGIDEEGPLLPTFEAFAISSDSAKQSSSRKSQQPTKPSAKISVGQLFREFVHFYSQKFNWRNEAISIRRGERAPPNVSLPLHIVLCNDVSEVALTIEDPFNAKNNLGACMNGLTLPRLREELLRASQLCTREATLTELLQPWVPAEDTPEKGSGSSPDED